MSSYDRVLITTPLDRDQVAELVASAVSGTLADRWADGTPTIELPDGKFAHVSDGAFWSDVFEPGAISIQVVVKDPDRVDADQAAAARAIFEALKHATRYHLVLLTDDGETFVDSRQALPAAGT